MSERDQLRYRTERLARKRAARGGRHSKRKGADAEKELAELLMRSWGVVLAARGHGRDVVSSLPGVHIEVKRVERLDVPGALRQAARDAGGRIAVLAHRSSRQPWLVTLELTDVPQLARLLAIHEEKP